MYEIVKDAQCLRSIDSRSTRNFLAWILQQLISPFQVALQIKFSYFVQKVSFCKKLGEVRARFQKPFT